jgi:hypothetical protein
MVQLYILEVAVSAPRDIFSLVLLHLQHVKFMFFLILLMKTAPSSWSNLITAVTGPKISSLTILMFGLVSVKIVGSNSTVYGLVASVFSKDIDRTVNTGHSLQAGAVWVRNYVYHTYPIIQTYARMHKG